MTDTKQPDNWPANARFSYGQSVKAIVKRRGQPRFPGFVVGWYEPLDKRHAGWAVEHFKDGLIHVYPDKALEERHVSTQKTNMVMIVQKTGDGKHSYSIAPKDAVAGKCARELKAMLWGADDRVITFETMDDFSRNGADISAYIVDVVVAEPL